MKFVTYQDFLTYQKTYIPLCLNDNFVQYDLNKINEAKIDKKHDKMIRNILSDTNELAKFLNQFLYLRKKIKQENLIQCKTDYITKQYKSRQCDILYKLKDRPIYFLIEHQSTVDYDMPRRLLEYVMEIIRYETMSKKLYLINGVYPVVVPIVIYTGFQKWKQEKNFSKKQFSELGYEKYRINMEYNLIDIKDYTFEELLKNRSLLSSFLIIEKCKTAQDLNSQMNNIIKIITDEKDKEKLSDIVINIIEPIVGKTKSKELLEKINIESEVFRMSPVQKMLYDLKMKSIKEGRQEGRRKGLQEGRQKGRREGRQEGRREGFITIAKNLLKRNMEIIEIHEITGLPINEIEKLKENL